MLKQAKPTSALQRASASSLRIHSQAEGWLPAVAAAHAAEADTWTDGDAVVRRVAGGFNNALYRVEVAGGHYACKLCVPDERRRAVREYEALRLLHQAGLDAAPQPLLLDESCTVVPFPVVVYEWLAGTPLEPPLSVAELASLLDSIHNFQALRPDDAAGSDLPDAWFHWFEFEPYFDELNDFLTEYGPWLASIDPAGRSLRNRLTRLVNGCEEKLFTSDVDPSRESVPVCLCRVDPNLANTVWGDDGRLRWVDWEYSGWGDPALELAELRWHAAFIGLTDDQHAWLRQNYRRPADDPAFEHRLALWDQLLATRWPFLVLRWWWSEDNGPDRLRLSRPAADTERLRTRLVHFIERAEHLVEASRIQNKE